MKDTVTNHYTLSLIQFGQKDVKLFTKCDTAWLLRYRENVTWLALSEMVVVL